MGFLQREIPIHKWAYVWEIQVVLNQTNKVVLNKQTPSTHTHKPSPKTLKESYVIKETKYSYNTIGFNLAITTQER